MNDVRFELPFIIICTLGIVVAIVVPPVWLFINKPSARIQYRIILILVFFPLCAIMAFLNTGLRPNSRRSLGLSRGNFFTFRLDFCDLARRSLCRTEPGFLLRHSASQIHKLLVVLVFADNL